MDYQYHFLNQFAVDSMANTLYKLTKNKKPIFVCIGSDLAIGDSLGPICGTILKQKINGYYIYGCLKKPVTAKEIQFINQFVKNAHPSSTIIAIDAAVGNINDIGLIKILDYGIKPGSGVNKKLDLVGDISIMGIVAERSSYHYSILHATRLNLVFTMAKIISESIIKFTTYQESSSKTLHYFRKNTDNLYKLNTNSQ